MKFPEQFRDFNTLLDPLIDNKREDWGQAELQFIGNTGLNPSACCLKPLQCQPLGLFISHDADVDLGCPQIGRDFHVQHGDIFHPWIAQLEENCRADDLTNRLCDFSGSSCAHRVSQVSLWRNVTSAEGKSEIL